MPSLAFLSALPLSLRPGGAPSHSVCAARGRVVGARAAVPVMSAVRGSSEDPYRIALLAGDGAGPAAAEVATTVLAGLADAADLHFEIVPGAYGAEAFDKHASLVPDETLAVCREADAVLRSYQGSERGDGRNGSAHRVLREKLGLFAQLRPVVVYPQLVGESSLRADVVANVDLMLVREVSAGALGENSEVGEGAEEARSTVGYTKAEVDRVASVALQVAERRSGRVLNVDKADAMSVSRFWRTNLHKYFEKELEGNDGVTLTDMYVDDFVREVILRPSEFDTIVTSNLFGDIVAEVIAALAGPSRIAPSVWVSDDGLNVYGPADLYNTVAYPGGEVAAREPSPVAMIRSASMMLRYALEETAAADLIQNALRKTLEDVDADKVTTAEFGESVCRSLQVMMQYDVMCRPEVCGE